MSGFFDRRTEAGNPKLALAAFTDMREYLEEYLPEGRAKSLALTKLDESRMWAQESIDE